MTTRLQAWLWCLLLIAAVIVPDDISATSVDVAEGNTAGELGDTADCSKDGTCDTGDLYAVFDGKKEEDKRDGDQKDGDEECVDKNEKCEAWASMGECEANSPFMLQFCKKSCILCGDVEVDLGVEQSTDHPNGDQIRERIDAARDYVKNDIAKNPTKKRLLQSCKLNNKDCALWAVLGECEANPVYMKKFCAPVCRSCHHFSVEGRCPIDLEKMPNAWAPGDLNEFFTNITTLESYRQFEPKVLSRPSYLPGDTKAAADYQVGPWVVVLENVLSQEEAAHMIELGAIEGYKQSADVGKIKVDGTQESDFNDGRTSTNAWCNHGCYKNETAKRVIERVTNITNIPEENSEYLQLLKYEVGQFYQTHHDYVGYLKERQSGVRMITIFLYLNDVEKGGETDLPDLGLTVQPKRGRAVIWPSVLDEDPDEKDARTRHQALPVISGVKYGANAWIHRRDFKTPYTNKCS